MKEPKVTVVVPVYKTETSLIDKCIESLLNQSYKNIEIQLIDDGNPEELASYVRKWADTHDNIFCIRHEQNKGLFQARLTGVRQSSSDYIMFVDSDDSVTVDWVRLLVKKAGETNADIVMGRTICTDENGWNYIYNRNYALNTNKDWNNTEILKNLMEDEGMNFSLHTVWNKLYSRELWNKAMSFYDTCDQHLIMTEDILFSVVLFYYAQKLSFSNHDGYFYYRNSASSTINTNGLKKAEKNLNDLIYAFSNVKKFLQEKGVFEDYAAQYKAWKDRYFRWWSYVISTSTKGGGKEAEAVRNKFFDFFEKDAFENAKPEDDFFTSAKTTWNIRLEEIKNEIMKDQYKIISFDIFDTLVKRPVLNPEDVFEVLINEIPQDIEERNSFIKLRKNAEICARRAKHAANSNCEDITLTEIYQMLEKKFGFSKETCEFFKKKENEIEIRLANQRNLGKELFEFAQYLGKKVIVVSDMYLEKDTVEAILHKNGYTGYEKLYLSSEDRLLKNTGHLFDYVLEDNKTDAKPSEVIHIGDNHNADFAMPNQKGMKGIHVPKVRDVLFQVLGNGSNATTLNFAGSSFNSVIDLSANLKNFSVRCLYAVAANQMFDNPFESYNEYSDYNSCPYVIGFLPLGIHMFGLGKWIAEKAEEQGYSNVIFTARDGYYLKKVYELLKDRYYTDAPDAKYLYISRKAMIPVDFCSEKKVYEIANNISFSMYSPKSIIEMYHSLLKPLTPELEDLYKKEGFNLTRKFTEESDCLNFLESMIRNQYDAEKAAEQYHICKKYYSSNVAISDVVFDLGYSAKLHKALVDVLGYHVDGLFVHNNGYDSLNRMRENGLRIESFYDFVPAMSGIVNEYLFSDYNGSCVGFQMNNGTAEPVFEEKEPTFIEKHILDEISRGSLDFVNAVLDAFSDHMELLQFQNINTGLQYEKFLMEAKELDKDVFRFCYIEDEYFGGISEKSIMELWNWQQQNRGLNATASAGYVPVPMDNYEIYKNNVLGKGKIKQALYWWITDKEFFRKRLKDYFSRNK